MNNSAEITLVISKKSIRLIDLEHFKVGISISNIGDNEIYFDISQTELSVNTERSIAWDLAVQNGTIINFTLQPHESKTVEWPLGKALFSTPGKYMLEFRWQEVVRTCEVTVSA